MNLNECIIKLCNYYQQPIKDKNERMPLIVMEVSKWVDDHVENFEDFYNQIIRSFIPTSENKFPRLSHLERFYVKPSKKYEPFPMIDELTIGEEIPKTIDKTAKDVLTEYLNDEIKLSFKLMLNKYGRNICQKIEGTKGKWSFDNNFEIISADGKERWPDGGWKSEMLLKYLED